LPIETTNNYDEFQRNGEAVIEQVKELRPRVVYRQREPNLLKALWLLMENC